MQARGRWAVIGILLCGGLCADCGESATCGEGTVLVDGVCTVEPTEELLPRVTSVTYGNLHTSTRGPHHVLHPISVQATVTVDAEPFEGEVVVGLETEDGSAGCLLGPLEIVHAPETMDDLTGTYELRGEFLVERGCEPLVDRPSRLTLAFDPWNNLEWTERAPYDPDMVTGTSVVDQVNLSRVEACDAGCEGPVELLANPGPDVELLHFELDSSVIVVPIPSHEVAAATADEIRADAEAAGLFVDPSDVIEAQEANPAELPTVPHISVGLDYRVLGREREEHLGADEVHFAYRIRPIEGAVGTEHLAPEELGWLPVHREHHEDMGGGEHRVDHLDQDFHDDLGTLDVHTTHAPLTFVGETLDRIRDGSWSHINEFELEVCANASMEEAVFPGDAAARQNHCADLHVVLIRQHHGPNGQIHETNHGTSAGVLDRSRVYEKWWRAGQAGLGVKAWLVNGFSDIFGGADFGEVGSHLLGPGSYYEAGAEANLEVFGLYATIARAYAQFRDHTAASGHSDYVAMDGFILAWQFLPHFDVPFPDGTISLGDLLDIPRARTGNDYPTEKEFRREIVGTNADVPCGGVRASVSAFVVMGLDEDSTAVTKGAATDTLPPTCVAGEPRSTDGRYCFVALPPQYRTIEQANAACVASFPGLHVGATLATVRDAGDLAAIQGLVGADWFMTNNIARVGYWTHFWRLVGEQPITASDATITTFDHQQGLTPAFTPFEAIDPLSHPPDWYTLHHSPDGTWHVYSNTTAAYNAVCMIPVRGEGREGTTLSVTVQPHLAAGLSAEIAIDFSFITFGIELVLNVIDFAVPFVADLTLYQDAEGRVIMNLGRSITASLTAMSGNFDVWIEYDTFFGTGTHHRTVAAWDGFELASFDILPRQDMTLTLF